MKRRLLNKTGYTLPALILLLFPMLLHAQSWSLTWNDEFDGPDINLSWWTYDVGDLNVNGECEYYTDNGTGGNNAFISNGSLIIRVIEEAMGGQPYTSARLKTQGLTNWTHGKVEARIKIPQEQGLWPAFWLLGENITSQGWPACGEIDIMENIGDNISHGSLHWDNGGYQTTTATTPVTITNWNVYGIIWNEDYMIWYVNDTIFKTYDISDPGMDEFHKPNFIILNMAICGWPGDPDGTTQLPADMLIDWVRVYQDNSTNSNQAPSVSIISPTNGAVISGTQLSISTFATDTDGEIAFVEFFEGNTSLGTVNTPPFSLDWPPYTGDLSIWARTMDQAGAFASSQTNNINFSRLILPTRVELENYRTGGEGIGYHDTDGGNSGGAYRTDDVDIQTCSEGGYNIGWTAASEWLAFDVTVSADGLYNFTLRAASGAAGIKTLHAELDGIDITGPISFTDDTDWQVYNSYTISNVSLSAEDYTLTVHMDTGNQNLNYLDVTLNKEIIPEVTNLTALNPGTGGKLLLAWDNPPALQTNDVPENVLQSAGDRDHTLRYRPDINSFEADLDGSTFGIYGELRIGDARISGKAWEAYSYLTFGLGTLNTNMSLIHSATLFLTCKDPSPAAAVGYPINVDHIMYSNNFSDNLDLENRFFCTNSPRTVLQAGFHQIQEADLTADKAYGIPVKEQVFWCMTNKKTWTESGSEKVLQIRLRDNDIPNANNEYMTFYSHESTGFEPTLKVYTQQTQNTGFLGVKVIRKTGSEPVDLSDGLTVFSNAGSGFTDNGLTDGTTYFYRVFTYYQSGKFSEGIIVSGTSTNTSGGEALFIVQSVQSVSISGKSSHPVPGSTLTCSVSFSNGFMNSVTNTVLFQNIQHPYYSYASNSSSAPPGWILEWSTNTDPDQEYESTEYTIIEPAQEKKQWIRWKRDLSPSGEKTVFQYSIIIR